MRSSLGLVLKNALASAPVIPQRADKFLCEMANVPDYDHSPDGPNARRIGTSAVEVVMPTRVREAWERVFHLFPDVLPQRGNPSHEQPHRPRIDKPGLVWQDPEDPEGVNVNMMDVPAKLRMAWRLPTDASRRMFLICELGYYLRGPAMFAVATKAHEAQVQERSRFEKEGVPTDKAVLLSIRRWFEVLHNEGDDPAGMWDISDADAFAQVLLRAIDIASRMRICSNKECPAPYFIAVRTPQRYCSEVCALPAQRASKRIWWSQHGHKYRGRSRKRTIVFR